MIGQGRIAAQNGWLVPLADLSMILFVITSSGLAMTDNAPAHKAGVAQGVPSSLYRDGDSAPALDEWLAQYSPGAGEQLTVLGTYTDGADREQIARRSGALADQAEAAGMAPRLIVQQAERAQVTAWFAHDRDPALAQMLLEEGQ